MSMTALTDKEYAAPVTKWSRTDKVHKQSWAQQAVAAADSLNMPKESVRKNYGSRVVACYPGGPLGGWCAYLGGRAECRGVPALLES